jgi:hypothetical protein
MREWQRRAQIVGGDAFGWRRREPRRIFIRIQGQRTCGLANGTTFSTHGHTPETGVP